MFSFFKRNKDNPEVPEWASYFKPQEYGEFLSAIDSWFRKMNISYRHDDGVIEAGENTFGFTNLGLSNVAQVCKQSKRSEYMQVVTEHFDSLVRAQKFDLDFRKDVSTFSKVSEYLAVRLYSDEYIGHLGKVNVVSKRLAGNISSVLVFDLPDSIINVQPEQVANWGKTNDELFEVGIQNSRRNNPTELSQQEINGFKIWFATAEHFFVPNIILDSGLHRKISGSNGALIGIPHRHSALIYPIENTEVITVVNQLIQIIHGMNIEGPGSLSNNLLWLKDGRFEAQPYTVEGGTLRFAPTTDFVTMLNSLAN